MRISSLYCPKMRKFLNNKAGKLCCGVLQKMVWMREIHGKMKAPVHTEPEEPTDPTERLAYKKWDSKLDNYD